MGRIIKLFDETECVCKRCRCTFAYEQGEIFLTLASKETVECPQCRNWIQVTPKSPKESNNE